MKTLILATSALHFIDAVLLAAQCEEPHLVLSGYQDKRARQFLSWLESLDDQIFLTARYQFMRKAKHCRPIIREIDPEIIITGNDDIREYQVINYVAKKHAKKRQKSIAFHYMDDGLNSYEHNPIHSNRFHRLRNMFRYLTKGYTRDRRRKVAQSKDLQKRYLFTPERFPVDDEVINEQIVITPLAKARIAKLAKIALKGIVLPKECDLILLPNERNIVDETDFLTKLSSIISLTKQANRVAVIKSHPSDSKHIAAAFNKYDHVLYLKEKIPAELLLGAISPVKIYSGHSTILITAKLLYPQVDLQPLET